MELKPPPLHGKIHLNFHFDYLHPSLSGFYRPKQCEGEPNLTNIRYDRQPPHFSNLNKWRTKMKPEEAENLESAHQNVTIENDPEVQFTMWRYVAADCFHF